uniref:Uncharacterized protein n=1 Tax=Anguilla anguilla TaxID=7936 RepID=A0A0E9PGN8_ANGAN
MQCYKALSNWADILDCLTRRVCAAGLLGDAE